MLAKCVIYSFLILITVGMVLPSDGNHGFLSPKSLSFSAAALFFMLYIFSKWKITLSQGWALLGLLSALFFGGIWYVIGSTQDQLLAKPFDHFKVLMLTFFVPLACWYLVKEKLLSSQTVLRTAILANCAYCSVKVVLMLLHISGFLNLWNLLQASELRYMSMAITESLSRIQTSVDIATPFLVFFLLQSNKLGLGFSKKFQTIFLVICSISVFLSFSRFLIFVLFISFVLHTLTVSLRNQIKLGLIALVLGCFVISSIGMDQTEKIIERRLFSTENTRSDAVRETQLNALLEACNEKPFFGFGLGGYTASCIRDGTLPHSYEVQWAAFLLQFGLIGLSILLIPLCVLMLRLNWNYAILFGVWLLSGLTNPFLISLTSAIIYTLFFLASEMANPYIQKYE